MPITKDWTKVWSISEDAMGVEYGYTVNVVDFVIYPQDENKFSSYGQMSTKIAVRGGVTFLFWGYSQQLNHMYKLNETQVLQQYMTIKG